MISSEVCEKSTPDLGLIFASLSNSGINAAD